MQIIFEEQRVVFYLNDKPILELPDVAAYEQYYPTVTVMSLKNLIIIIIYHQTDDRTLHLIYSRCSLTGPNIVIII